MSFEEKYELVKETIKHYPDQFLQAWEEVQALEIPEDYKNIKNIVFCGMGGSALGARIVDSLLMNELSVPLEIFNEYHVPAYANEDTLVVVSSYSGTTEETLYDLKEAQSKHTKIIGMTTGGILDEELKKAQIPSYVFNPKHNPSLQPRMSIGYAVGGVLSLFVKLGLVTLSQQTIDEAITHVRESIAHYADETTAENTAYNLAQKIENKMPVLVASEHLYGAVYTVKNQFNESAKTFATLFKLPELNHHLMEGLSHPVENKNLLYFIFFNSHLYTDRVQKRYPITQEVVTQNQIAYSTFAPTGMDRLSQVLESLVFGSFVVYYLTKKYDIDPMAIPWVDYFKKELAK